MKTIFNSILFLALSFFLVACGGDAATSNSETNNPPKEESTSLTCNDLNSKFDELKDQEITIKAISWGASETMSGVNLALGDEVLSGLKQAKVQVVFSTENGAIAKAIEKDAEVTIKATVSESKHGAIYLTNPTVL
ncbi:MAG: hypothetical protein GY810_03695 [Aureispira sp.]|nr:hypothetical protein [Aureispira sp.]